MKKKKTKLDIPFNADEYSYRAHYSPEDEEFIGLVDEFPGLSVIAPSLEEAIKEIRVVVDEVLQIAAERGEMVPEPLNRRDYSGKFVVRIKPALHRRLALAAARRDISLNEYITERLTE
jgi:predicted HicB family RNase H-like nuclease